MTHSIHIKISCVHNSINNIQNLESVFPLSPCRGVSLAALDFDDFGLTGEGVWSVFGEFTFKWTILPSPLPLAATPNGNTA